MNIEVPVLNANKEPDGQQFYVMECTLRVERRETVGGVSTESMAELNAYLSKEMLESALDMMARVVDE